jgi:hypothetical protein
VISFGGDVERRGFRLLRAPAQELHSEYLEEQILNQISVVFEGQIFPLWIRRQTMVHLKIVSTAPSKVVRLVRDAELVIAPKPRFVRDEVAEGAFPLHAPAIVASLYHHLMQSALARCWFVPIAQTIERRRRCLVRAAPLQRFRSRHPQHR